MMRLRKTTVVIILGALSLSILPLDADARGGRGGGFHGGGRGFGGMRGRGGYYHHFDGMGRWGGWGEMRGAGRYGGWGGWARPYHRFRAYGWGGWGVPYYAGGAGYGYMNYDDYDTVDEEGGMYEGRDYTMPIPPAVGGGGYTWTSGTAKIKSPDEVKKAQKPLETVQTHSRYRLGPDADVLDGGHIAFHLTKDAFLYVTSDNTKVVDRKTGQVVMTLATDPTLLWHVASELRRQSLGLKAALLNKTSLSDQKKYELLTQAHLVDSAKDKTPASEALKKETKDVTPDKKTDAKAPGKSQPEKTEDSTNTGETHKTIRLTDDQQQFDANEIENLHKTISLLDLTSKNLGKIPEAPPSADEVKGPDPNAIELFASVWLTRDGQFILYRRVNGSIAYINSRGIYSDRGQTPLKEEYPDKFELVVYDYLKKLNDEADSTMAKLKEDQSETEWSLSQLEQQLEEGMKFKPEDDENTRRLKEDFSHRLIQATLRSEARLKAIKSQLQSMPIELDTAKKAMAMINVR